MSVVRRVTNTATGMHWLRRTVSKAARLARNTKWFGVQDGYMLWAKRSGNRRTATLLDMPPQIRVVGSLGSIGSQFMGQPRLNAAANRDPFDPAVGATPPLIPQTAIDAAKFPTNWQTVAVDDLPSVFGVFTGGAIARKHNNAKLWFAGNGASLNLVNFYPLDNGVELYYRGEFIQRGDAGTAVTVIEPYVTSISSGFVFSPRDIDPEIGEKRYPVVIPYATIDYDPDAAILFSMNPVVKPISKTAENTKQDYGQLALFATRTDFVNTPQSSTDLYLFNFPAVDAFEQSLWFGEEATGYAPALVFTEAVIRPDGTIVAYGNYFSFIYGTAATEREEFEQMLTRFRMTVNLSAQTSWEILSCHVSGTDGSLDGRRLNSVQGEFEWCEKPLVFYGDGSSWAFWACYEINSSGMSFGGGGVSTATDFFIRIMRDSTQLDVGVPTNITLNRALNQSAIFITQPPNAPYNSPFAVVHVDEAGVFGFSFFGWDRTTEELKLCKWDTINGFGFWDVDMTAMNLIRADRLPSISLYQKATVAEGEVVGTPSFVANSEFEGADKTFLIARGVAQELGAVSGLQVVALGNELQSTPLDNIYNTGG